MATLSPKLPGILRTTASLRYRGTDPSNADNSSCSRSARPLTESGVPLTCEIDGACPRAADYH